MYFSRFMINPAKGGARKLLSNPQALHAAVMATNPPDVDLSDGRILWRLDRAEHSYTLYMLSPEEPDFTVLIEQAGWVTRPGESAHYGRLLAKLENGQEWAFRLAANPVKRVRKDDGKEKVYPHVTPAQQSTWLRERAEQWGFEIVPAQNQVLEDAPMVSSRRDLGFARKDAHQQNRIGKVTLRKVQFDGYLRITDADKFRYALTHGMGRGKAYGLGLMTLAPVNR